MEFSVEIKRKLEGVFDERQASVLSEVITNAYSFLVKASDFNELKEIAKELVQAQKRTEQRIGELTEAQKRTEQRVEELAQAQKASEERLTRVEKAVEDLAQAQKRTEQELHELIKEHRITRKELGGLSITVGYRLEDEAIKALPRLLKKDFGLRVEGGLKRGFVKDKEGKDIEVNIIGNARRNGKKVTIIGEGKSQLSKNAVDEFLKRKIKRLESVYKEIFPVLVTYMISEPDVESYLEEKGIALYYSYNF